MAGREPVAQRARAVLDTHQGAPSAAQLAAGNYPKRRLRFAGLDVTVETEAGCVRSGVDGAGRRWERRGVWRTIFLMWRLRWAYWRGVPVAQLAEAYR